MKKITNLRDRLKVSYGGTPVSLIWAIDATGVGSGIVSMLESAMPEETMFSIYMTAGQSTTVNRYDVHIGKQQLVSTLVGTLNSGTLHLPPNASDLIEELQNYEVHTSEACATVSAFLRPVLTTMRQRHWHCRCGPARTGG